MKKLNYFLNESKSKSLVIIILLMVITLLQVDLNKTQANLDDMTAQRALALTDYNHSQIKIDLLESEINELKSHIGIKESIIHAQGREIELKAIHVNVLEELRDQYKTSLESYENIDEWYRDIPLDIEYQKYLYEQCKELGIDHKLSLGKIDLESQFDINAIGYNKDENGNILSEDRGLMQINSGNLDWMETIDPERPLDVYNSVKDNIRGGLLVYKHYKDYWAVRGYTGRELQIRALNSYNRGIQGYLNYMEEGHAWDEWRYARIVMSRADKYK